MNQAEATLRDVKICIDIQTDYTQIITMADYWTSNAVRPFRGRHIAVLGGGIFASDYLSSYGSSPGCRSYLLDDNNTYLIYSTSNARVGGRQISSWEDNGSGLVQRTSILTTNFSPTSAPVQTATFSLPYDWVNGTLLAAGYILYRNHYGTPLSYQFKIDTTACCITGEWIKAGIDALRTIGHEVGHAVGRAVDESTGPAKNYNAPMNGCNGYGNVVHTQNSKEYTSAAAVESFADFVAVSTFNSRGHSDCHYRKSSSGDWDLDGDVDAGRDNHISCEGVAMDLNHDGDTNDAPDESSVASFLTARDWLKKVEANTTACSPPLTNRATRHDWLRFWWDLSTDEGLHPTSVGAIWDAANPKNWFTAGGPTAHPNMPANRILNACSSLGFGTECDDQKNNGITH